ncbi:hypothetical protein QOZ83_02140 [Romboutsia sedimentorum]|uniref:hypothetical protein n=1 Tax=Romboutsia sedimentorum TaxID=1368474 RepID=UPI0024DE4C8C|nr:hypothetical protein [Romboutsia sedimentorum]MDK2584646.1 hypothetical protein [Romboutsia sedimentorum]
MELREIMRMFFLILALGILCALFVEVKKIKNIIEEEEDFEILKYKSLKFSSKIMWLIIIGTIFRIIAILLD